MINIIAFLFLFGLSFENVESGLVIGGRRSGYNRVGGRSSPLSKNSADAFFKVKESRKERILRRLSNFSQKKMKKSKRVLGLMGPSAEEKSLLSEIDEIKQKITTLNMDEMVTENTKKVFVDLKLQLATLRNNIEVMANDLPKRLHSQADSLLEFSSFQSQK